MKINKLFGISIAITFVLIFSTIPTAESFCVDVNDKNVKLAINNAKWTVMVYFAGDSHRGNDFDYILDLLNQIGSNDKLNIVGLFD
jgi:hypothetical protein